MSADGRLPPLGKTQDFNPTSHFRRAVGRPAFAQLRVGLFVRRGAAAAAAVSCADETRFGLPVSLRCA